MHSLTAADFTHFFQTLHGVAPFPWQVRLAERVTGAGGAQHAWPRQIALPTACGKTTCIDVALFSLACAASDISRESLTAPRRIFFVVDRRIIVDQAFRRARAIKHAFEHALTLDGSSIVKAVAENLRAIAIGPHGEGVVPLQCYQLRGGVYRDDAWAHSPTQPFVVCTTVDQIGSRLLFRGYGRSPKVSPVHAGLIANDSLILLDEAHCSIPFAQTLEAVRRYRSHKWADKPLESPFSVAVMSATLPYDDEAPFVLQDDDYADTRLGPRLLSDKPARLAEEIKAKTATSVFAQALVKEAKALAERGARRIAIIVNRVRTAKLAFDLLAGVPEERKALFLGRMRPLDSKRLTDTWTPKIQSDRMREGDDEPIFVVSTQCLEVGADYDFDGLVCECASLEALRQRFGRLKRLGLGKCWATIMISAEDAKGKTADPIYGPALPAVWNWLRRHAAPGENDDELLVNMGVEAVRKLLATISADEITSLLMPARNAPVMLPAHLDCWIQTSPPPAPSPEVALFLHGDEKSLPEVQVCWRADLDVDPNDPSEVDDARRCRWIDLLSLCPPSSPECMSVPLYVVRRWLDGQVPDDGSLSDVDGASIEDEEPDEGVNQVCALRWRGPDDDETVIIKRSSELSAGDTIVVPAVFGGWHEFGYIPGLAKGEPAIDIGDEANLTARNRPVLRIYPGVSRSWYNGSTLLDNVAFETAVEDLVCTSKADDVAESFSDTQWLDQLRADLHGLGDVTGRPEWLRDVATALAADLGHVKNAIHLHPSGWPDFNDEASEQTISRTTPATAIPVWRSARKKPEFDLEARGLVIIGRKRRGLSDVRDTFTGEDDTSTSTVKVPLAYHLTGVATLADRFARNCGLPGPIKDSLRLAGELHDIGKLDLRFQAWLHSGNVASALAAAEPLAKSTGRSSRTAREKARRRSGYPKGGRHELLSLQLALSDAHTWSAEIDPDLVLHLIACHHGYCRPFAPSIADDAPPEVSWQRNGMIMRVSKADREEWKPARFDSGIADRFWRLARRYGWWGLAWLEALFILADWRQSEFEMEREHAVDAGKALVETAT